jgi:uncharacterized Zn finger protein (UPF0148 family)
MKVRGERECTQCGSRWSYYETGSVVCPECGSMRSVGVNERKEHTAGAAELDLAPIRNLTDEVALADLAAEAESVSAEFVRRAGFIDAGELRPLDDTYVAAQDLRHVAAELGRAMRVSDAEEYYFLELLGGADDGERPLPTDVPDSLRGARGLAAAAAVDAYRSDVRRYLDDHPDPTAARLLGTLNEHKKRIEALDGDVDPRTAESLLDAARDIGHALVNDEEGKLVEAQTRLDGLSAAE